MGLNRGLLSFSAIATDANNLMDVECGYEAVPLTEGAILDGAMTLVKWHIHNGVAGDTDQVAVVLSIWIEAGVRRSWCHSCRFPELYQGL